MKLDAATRRRLVSDTAVYYEYLVSLIDRPDEAAGALDREIMPWASERQKLFNAADRAGQSLGLDAMMAVLGEFDQFWEEIQRIQAGFALTLLVAITVAGADLDVSLRLAAAGVTEMVQSWSDEVDG